MFFFTVWVCPCHCCRDCGGESASTSVSVPGAGLAGSVAAAGSPPAASAPRGDCGAGVGLTAPGSGTVSVEAVSVLDGRGSTGQALVAKRRMVAR